MDDTAVVGFDSATCWRRDPPSTDPFRRGGKGGRLDSLSLLLVLLLFVLAASAASWAIVVVRALLPVPVSVYSCLHRAFEFSGLLALLSRETTIRPGFGFVLRVHVLVRKPAQTTCFAS